MDYKKIRYPIITKHNAHKYPSMSLSIVRNNARKIAAKNMAEAIVSRAYLSGQLGKSYYASDGTGAQRDLYKTLGYKRILTFDDYYAKYKRQDIATSIVDIYPDYTWKLKPEIVDFGNKKVKSDFEKDWSELCKKRKIWHYLARADRISGIGTFGIIFLGFNDGAEFHQEVKRKEGMELLYIMPYSQGSVNVQEWDEDKSSERYGRPKIYQITLDQRSSDESTSAGESVLVHHSRIIHIAENCLENDVYGVPRLEKIFNRLQDIELITGGASEMFWRGAFPGYAFSAKDDAQFEEGDLDDLEDEIQDYLHEMRRYLRLQGIEVKELKPQIESPKDHFDILVTIIASATGIPKRLLTGSERGELASTQDERAFLGRVEMRREDHAEPIILRPLIDKLIDYKILPEPEEGGYSVQWPPLFGMEEKEESEVTKNRIEAFAKYVSTPGADDLIPEEFFLRRYMNLTTDDITEIETLRTQMEKFVSGDEDTGDEEDGNIEEGV